MPIMSLSFLFYLSVAGVAGVISRYFLTASLDKLFLANWLGTAIINMVGSLLAGALFALAEQKNMISQENLAILLIGFCGGFTTYSAYSLQSFQLIQQGLLGQALINLIILPLAGLLYVFIGYYSVRFFL
nr:fluoride efflux transporter CrcB [Bdellovibrio sp. HAGR004]